MRRHSAKQNKPATAESLLWQPAALCWHFICWLSPMDSVRDSIPIAISRLRGAFADFVEGVRQGGRIRITRHGKPVAWIIGKAEHAILEQYERNRRKRVPEKSGRPEPDPLAGGA